MGGDYGVGLEGVGKSNENPTVIPDAKRSGTQRQTCWTFIARPPLARVTEARSLSRDRTEVEENHL